MALNLMALSIQKRNETEVTAETNRKKGIKAPVEQPFGQSEFNYQSERTCPASSSGSLNSIIEHQKWLLQ